MQKQGHCSLHSEAADGISCSANLFHSAGWSFLFSFHFVLEIEDQNLNVSITCSVAKELHPIPSVLPFFVFNKQEELSPESWKHCRVPWSFLYAY